MDVIIVDPYRNGTRNTQNKITISNLAASEKTIFHLVRAIVPENAITSISINTTNGSVWIDKTIANAIADMSIAVGEKKLELLLPSRKGNRNLLKLKQLHCFIYTYMKLTVLINIANFYY